MTEKLAPNTAVSVPSVAVPHEDIAAEDVVSGEPKQGVVELGELGGTDIGVWELTQGAVTDTETDEFFVVVSGGATIEILEGEGSGTSVTVAAGDTMRLAAGTRTKWIVNDHIRKVYIAA